MKLIDLVIKQNYKRANIKGIKHLKKIVMDNDCPSYYGFKDSGKKPYCQYSDCNKCWNREVEDR